MCFFSSNLLLRTLSHLVQAPNSKSDSNCWQGKEVVDVTIAVEDEKGNSIAGKEVVDVTMLQPIHQLDCNPVFYTFKCYFFTIIDSLAVAGLYVKI